MGYLRINCLKNIDLELFEKINFFHFGGPKKIFLNWKIFIWLWKPQIFLFWGGRCHNSKTFWSKLQFWSYRFWNSHFLAKLALDFSKTMAQIKKLKKYDTPKGGVSKAKYGLWGFKKFWPLQKQKKYSQKTWILCQTCGGSLGSIRWTLLLLWPPVHNNHLHLAP